MEREIRKSETGELIFCCLVMLIAGSLVLSSCGKPPTTSSTGTLEGSYWECDVTPGNVHLKIKDQILSGTVDVTHCTNIKVTINVGGEDFLKEFHSDAVCTTTAIPGDPLPEGEIKRIDVVWTGRKGRYPAPGWKDQLYP